MSYNLPDEIQLEIMKRLPVKSLIQFRSVSRTWKSHINSSDFIIKHFSHRTQSQHLLVRYREIIGNPNLDEVARDDTYVSIIDDDTFPKHKVFWSVPILVNMIVNHPRVIGTSHGLMCLHSETKGVVFLWNISIRKVVVVVVPPNKNKHIYETVLGFGVCRGTNDPKIVKVTFDDGRCIRKGEERVYLAPKVEVFTLSTEAWRSSYGNLPRESIQFLYLNSISIDGVYYWLAKDRIAMDNDRCQYIIISFDMTCEEFREVTLPHSLIFVSMCKLGESLVVVGPDKHDSHVGYNVWMLVDGFPKSFTKIFTFTPIEYASVSGFRRSNEPIILFRNGELAVYEPFCKRINKLCIKGSHKSLEVYDYMETLLLVDKPNFMVYDDTVKVES